MSAPDNIEFSENAAPSSEKHRRLHDVSGALQRIEKRRQKEREEQQAKKETRVEQREKRRTALRRLARWNRIRRQAASPRDYLLRLINHHETVTTILLAIVSGGIVLLTYSGVSMPMSESGAGIIEKGHALSFSIVIGVLSWIGWSAVFTFVPKLTGRRLALGLAASTVYLELIAAIDAPMNMLALAGPSAVQMSLVDLASHYEQRASGIFDAGIRSSQLLPKLRADSRRFDDLEQQEIEFGTMSGSPDPGAVSASLGQIAIVLTSLADSIETGVESAGEMKARITAAIAELKRHAYTQGDIRERSAAVSASADTVDELLSLIGQYDYTVSIAATASTLESMFPAADELASGFAQRQADEIAAIGEMAKPVARSLRDALRSDVSVETGFVRPMNAMQAVRHYWRELLPQWVAAVFVDFAAGFILLIYLAARREANKLAPKKTSGEKSDR